MIETFTEENGTSIVKTRKMGPLYKVRDGMECFHICKDSETGLHMSMLSLWDKVAQAGKRPFRSRAVVIGLSVTITAGVYWYCAALAYLERGYKAYGGECLAAMTAGVLTYKAVSLWAKERR